MDVTVVRTVATYQGWASQEDDYLAAFWNVLVKLNPDDLRRFTVFVSASTRMPLKGWKDFVIQVQKNGVGDDRLPTAYTCFQTMLLPLYSSIDLLRNAVEKAINNSQGFGLQ